MAIKFMGRLAPQGLLKIKQMIKVALSPAAPQWLIPLGSIGTYNERSQFSYKLDASDPNNDILTWSIVGGALPDGITINQFSGLLSGTLPSVDSDTGYNFSARVSDGTGFTITGDFSINVVNLPSQVSWQTPEDMGSINTGREAGTGVKAVSQ